MEFVKQSNTSHLVASLTRSTMKPRSLPFVLVFFLTLFPVSLAALRVPGYAQETVTIKDVKIAGNFRVEDEGIRLHIKNRPGALYDPAVVEQDVKAIFRMGFFDDVRAELSADGVLTYAVKEKPYVRDVKLQGNSQ
ncbi:MAG: POTRA domain-containing protein, partial [Candidatus Binatia bacterium]